MPERDHGGPGPGPRKRFPPPASPTGCLERRPELPDRLDAVLTVVHLLFTTGHTAPGGGRLVNRRPGGCAISLARMLRQLDAGRVRGRGDCWPSILLTDARRATWCAPDGRLLLLEEQDRSQWDRPVIDEGTALVRAALRGRPPGRFALQAAIAAVHAEAPSYGDDRLARGGGALRPAARRSGRRRWSRSTAPWRSR